MKHPAELVRLGLGVTFQAPWAFRDGWQNEEFTWRRVRQLQLQRAWYFAWPASYAIDIRGYTLLRLCQQAAHRIGRELRASDRFVSSPLEKSVD
ncbi:MAG: hypothetical protein LR015_13525 [Verrucomicrobia bacterium]|nr:hypothetical protein [Verrucomicrobiota bacterium]